ncbi:TIGR02302 family protein [Mesorhizobium sp. KR2-14]|uniref:TIGR02302 family protein n=1 Tax=Mesorhizobium sp. KR2-14 TaxID=3156610 RepID=UPI0032B546E7
MTETPANTADGRFVRRLRRARLATLASMMVERGWPLVLPLLVTASLFVSLAWLGVFRIVPELVRFGLLGVFALAALAALYPLRFYRQPSPAEVDRRIEAASRLPHTPVLVQTDRPSGPPSAFAQVLWREHQRRMAEKLGDIDSDAPRPRVPERDPWGLRDAAALLLFVAFAFSQGPLGGSIADAFRPGSGFESIPPRIDAWVTPPAYTGKPPMLLTSDAKDAYEANFTVPQGSEVSLRVSGGSGNETLTFTDASGAEHEIATKAATPVATAATAAREFAGKLDADGVLSLTAGRRELRQWTFSIIPDKPPTIRFLEDPKQAANGALELNYEILDDYGAASAKAEFELASPQAAYAHPLYKAPELKLALPRRGGDGKARTSRDLTDHVWAGSTVRLTLKATDDAGQEAVSETKTFTLPERPFANPLARAVTEQRRIFSLDANRKPYALELIDAITLRPEETFDSLANFLGLMAGRTQLKIARSDDQLRATSDYFWQMAQAIEDGSLSTAEKRLRQAQEALKQALQNGASDDEIDKLMKELRQAMSDFLREFAERAKRDPNLARQQQQDGQELRQSDLERMMDQIENLAKSGNKDMAEQLLSQLQDMMNNLQAGRQQQGQGQGQGQSETRRQMDKLGEIMRRQQEMMNDTFRLDQMQRGQQEDEFSEWQRGGPLPHEGRGRQDGHQGKGQKPGKQPGSQPSPDDLADALKQLQQGQGKLRKDLQGLTKDMEKLGIQPGKDFGEAGDAMGQAEDALGDAEGNRAVGEQGRALEALRRGAQDMMKQMRQAMQDEQGGSKPGGQQNSDRDPLGRPRATTGPDFGNSVKVPDEIDVQRARQILDAIRKRLGNALSPEIEKRYLERLLEMR